MNISIVINAFQALTPLVFTIIPFAAVSMAAELNITWLADIQILSNLYVWMGAINAIISIVVVKPYRKAVMDVIGIGKGGGGGTTAGTAGTGGAGGTKVLTIVVVPTPAVE